MAEWKSGFRGRWAAIVTFAYMAAILMMSSVPGVISDDAPISHQVFLWVPSGVQNALHIPVYAGLALLCCATLSGRLARIPALLGGFLVAAGFGVFDEWYQSFIPGRWASMGDVLSNTVGAGLGVAVFQCFQKSLHKYPHKKTRGRTGE